MRALERPPHCCAPILQAKVVLVPLRFTAALHGCRVRRADGSGMTALSAVFNATAAALEASLAALGRGERPLVVVVASNSVAFDYLGAAYPWSYGRTGQPPRGVVRISTELRFRAVKVGSIFHSLAVHGSKPWGYTGSSARTSIPAARTLAHGTSRGKSSPPGQQDSIRLDLAVATPTGTTGSGVLTIGGSGKEIHGADHPLVRQFLTVPYGTVHGCAPPPGLRVRDLLLAFWGCLPSQLIYPYGLLWRSRIDLAAALRARPDRRVRIVNTCASQSASNPGPRRFALEGAYSTYARSLFCLAPSGDAVSSSRLFDALAYGCIPVVTNAAVVLPFAADLDWDACVIWHPIGSVVDARSLLSRLASFAGANATASLLHRQSACARLRNAVLFFEPRDQTAGATASSAAAFAASATPSTDADATAIGACGGCCSGAIAYVLRRLREPRLIVRDWQMTMRSIGKVRVQGHAAREYVAPSEPQIARPPPLKGHAPTSTVARGVANESDARQAAPSTRHHTCTWENGCCKRHSKHRSCRPAASA